MRPTFRPSTRIIDRSPDELRLAGRAVSIGCGGVVEITLPIVADVGTGSSLAKRTQAWSGLAREQSFLVRWQHGRKLRCLVARLQLGGWLKYDRSFLRLYDGAATGWAAGGGVNGRRCSCSTGLAGGSRAGGDFCGALVVSGVLVVSGELPVARSSMISRLGLSSAKLWIQHSFPGRAPRG